MRVVGGFAGLSGMLMFFVEVCGYSSLVAIVVTVDFTVVIKTSRCCCNVFLEFAVESRHFQRETGKL